MNDIVFGFREEVAVRVSTRATHRLRNLLVVSLQRHFNPPTHPPTLHGVCRPVQKSQSDKMGPVWFGKCR